MKNVSFQGVGCSILILIFSALCLAASSLICLSNAKHNMFLSEKFSDAVYNYYLADSKAVETIAQVQAELAIGKTPEEIGGIVPDIRNAGVFMFFSQIDSFRAIEVKMKITDSETEILSWQEIYTGEWRPDDTLIVWDGEDFSEY